MKTEERLGVSDLALLIETRRKLADLVPRCRRLESLYATNKRKNDRLRSHASALPVLIEELLEEQEVKVDG